MSNATSARLGCVRISTRTDDKGILLVFSWSRHSWTLKISDSRISELEGTLFVCATISPSCYSRELSLKLSQSLSRPKVLGLLVCNLPAGEYHEGGDRASVLCVSLSSLHRVPLSQCSSWIKHLHMTLGTFPSSFRPCREPLLWGQRSRIVYSAWLSKMKKEL